jgi:hypothetical protein
MPSKVKNTFTLFKIIAYIDTEAPNLISNESILLNVRDNKVYWRQFDAWHSTNAVDAMLEKIWEHIEGEFKAVKEIMGIYG